jgi:hypothetical protein
MLWSEPRGANGTVITVDEQSRKDYSKLRRFVIVGRHRGSSICLPIHTYGRQGTSKFGCRPQDHAIIYSTESAPKAISGEDTTLLRKSIRCKMNSSRDKLDATSRLNYAKLYTVEHNVKVQFIGKISKSHENRIVAVYNEIHKLADRPIDTFGSFEHDDIYPNAQSDLSYSYPSTGGTLNQPAPYTTLNTGYDVEYQDPYYADAGPSGYDTTQDDAYYQTDQRY